MLLAVDIGNSQSSFGIFEGKRLKFQWHAETKTSRTADEYAAYFLPLFQHHGLEIGSIHSVAVCSVVPASEQAFSTFCNQYLNQSPFKVHHQLNLGFNINVVVPHEVGADRLANTAYAVAELSLPAVVIDLGTATTFDVVTADKVYEGGMILPGVRLAVEALSVKTAKLPSTHLDFPEKAIGKTTASCIQSGVLFGYVDLMDGLIERIEKELGEKVTVALTGGYSFLFAQKLKHSARHIPELTLEGIRILIERQ